MVIDDQNCIGQEQHKITLIFRAIHVIFDVVKLKSQIIAKCAVEPDLVIGIRAKQVCNGTHNGKHGWRSGAFFFGNDLV